MTTEAQAKVVRNCHVLNNRNKVTKVIECQTISKF
jgi:hypothetical protein